MKVKKLRQKTLNIQNFLFEYSFPEEKLKRAAQEEGMKDIFQHGVEKVGEGITTLEEVLRVTVLEKAA